MRVRRLFGSTALSKCWGWNITLSGIGCSSRLIPFSAASKYGDRLKSNSGAVHLSLFLLLGVCALLIMACVPSFRTWLAMAAPRRRGCSFLFISSFGRVRDSGESVKLSHEKKQNRVFWGFLWLRSQPSNSQSPYPVKAKALNGSQVVRISGVK